MKMLFINLLFICGVKNALCQVSGKLVTDSGRAVSFANVVLMKSTDSVIVKATLTDEEGAFRIEYPRQGTYHLRLASIGYQTRYSPVFEIAGAEKNKDIGTMIMKEDNQQLEAVVVRAEKPMFQQQEGGLVVNVGNSALTKGSSVLQVLERSPGVVIDHRNNGIALNGKTGVLVMLNGKLMPMQADQVVSLLNSMSADDIEKIELLTTPPAKYDATGNAGLINIVLKKNKKQGTNGNVSVTAGYGWGEKGTGSANLSHSTKHINLYGSYTFSHNRTYSELYITSTQDMPFMGGRVSVLFLDTTKLVQNNHDAAVGIDVKLNSKITIGGNINYNGSNTSVTTFNNAGYNILPDSLLQFTGENKGANRWNNLVNSLYFEKAIKEGEKINIDMDYLYFNNRSRSEVQSSFVNRHGVQAGENNNLFSPRQKGLANTVIRVGVAKLDYTKQISKKVKLETGAKGTYTQSSSLSGIQSLVNNVWTGSDQTSNSILMKEATGAIYASLGSQVSPSVNLVIGVRYEYANTKMNNAKTGDKIVRRQLGAIFPNLFLSKKVTDDAELQLSYSKRISRPSYNDLASYVWYSDPTAVYTGNPFLKPTITNNLKLGYNYKSYSFSLLFSRDINPIQRYQLTESPARDILFISPQNLAWQNNITFQTNLPLKLNNWWSMNYGLVAGLRQFKADYTIQPFQKTYFGYSVNFSQAFSLPKKFSAEISGWYNSFSYNGTTKVEGFGSLDIGIKKELKNNGGTFQLAASDLLRTVVYKVHYGTLTQEAFSIKSNVAVTTESSKFPIIKLTYSRSFGSGAMKTQRKEAGGKDESDRIRKD